MSENSESSYLKKVPCSPKLEESFEKFYDILKATAKLSVVCVQKTIPRVEQDGIISPVSVLFTLVIPLMESIKSDHLTFHIHSDHQFVSNLQLRECASPTTAPEYFMKLILGSDHCSEFDPGSE